MNFIFWIILGLIAGGLARWIMSGEEQGGWVLTMLLGVVGAFVGGWLGTLLGFGNNVEGALSLASIATATIGAIVILFIYRVINK